MRTKLQLWIIIYKYLNKYYTNDLRTLIIYLYIDNILTYEEENELIKEIRQLKHYDVLSCNVLEQKDFIKKRISFYLNKYTLIFFVCLYFFILLLELFLNEVVKANYFFIPGLIIILISFIGMIYSEKLTKLIIKQWKIY